MKFASLASVLALAASGVKAANSEDAEFLTKLVSDYDAHKTQYLAFARTASAPAELTELATKVATYKDDSYTTLLDNTDYDISALKDFATELPWYTRLEASGSGGSSESGSSDSSKSTTAGGAGSAMVAPVGAAVGAFVIALL
ncbi:hypothetical protein C7M61_004308 [Candidozyma pseudohaemuli]|uniref:Temperature shock-inducible protein 1 n=1 Tax=Candidozyma pseudohaemuli TaxID=418784 RepID=A0A2P7YIM6_9ASCO|nr:hypothetical protein C7M61_004308 [[Candida] pseudohaemulonii]PSK35826.1 hypothetical protein C7M61_004308 [[Candida] pseudohaemulonii]